MNTKPMTPMEAIDPLVQIVNSLRASTPTVNISQTEYESLIFDRDYYGAETVRLRAENAQLKAILNEVSKHVQLPTHVMGGAR